MQPGSPVRIGPLDARVLFSQDQIHDRVEEIGASLRGRYGSTCPIFIGLLHGGFVFLADLIRAYGAPHEVDFLKVSRYDPRQKDPTAVRVMQDLRSPIQDRPVIVVEGIRARGSKIEYVDRFLKLHGPRSLEYCAMICPSEMNTNIPVHEAGFPIGNEFVVGYGLDLREQHRNLAFISAVEHDAGAEALKGAP